METWDAITARRNVREFADRVIPARTSTECARPARSRPLRRTHQTWGFVIVTDRMRGGGHIANAAAAVALADLQ